MSYSTLISIVALAGFAVAKPLDDLQARAGPPAPRCTAAGGALSAAFACLNSSGLATASTICSNLLIATTTDSSNVLYAVSTLYLDTTTSNVTVVATPPVTSTTIDFTTNNTIFATANATVTSGMITRYVDTTTTTLTINSAAYTCASPTPSALPSLAGAAASSTDSGSTPSNSSTASTAVSGSPTGASTISSGASTYSNSTAASSSSGNPPTANTTTSVANATTPVSSNPACLTGFATFGRGQLYNACTACAGVYPGDGISTVYASTVYEATVTIVRSVVATTTVTPVDNATITQPATAFSTITANLTVPSIVNATSTVTVTTTGFLTLPFPKPSDFAIYYRNSTSNTPYFGAVANLKNKNTQAICFNPRGPTDIFTLDTSNRLVDTSDNSLFLAVNDLDPAPWTFPVNSSTTVDTPLCVGCDSNKTIGNQLFCDYPETYNNTFAICDVGVAKCLALGPGAELDPSICSPIDLLFNPITAAK